MNLIHVNCGGEVWEALTDGYAFEGEDAEQFGAWVPAYVCAKCHREIGGDADVMFNDPLLDEAK